MTDKPDWILFINSIDESLELDERAERIAEVLKDGNPSKEFLRLLASAIRPDNIAHGFKFELKNRAQGRPAGPDWSVGKRMHEIVDVLGQSVDEAVYQVQLENGRKGHSRSKCFDALRAYRREIEEQKWFKERMERFGPEN
ncbi:hypothetical protein [Aquicoccus sp. SU-CL01552]|uniref:hypothetical protein n=1 Tax=Aquicoccus sp. SU-CL01552 TaxID=3127656 RepID=UPI003104B0B7